MWEITEFGRGLIVGLILGGSVSACITTMVIAMFNVSRLSDEQAERVMRAAEIKHDKKAIKKRISKAMLEGRA